MRPGGAHMANIGIIGAGSWGTAISSVLAGNGHDVTIWSIVPEEVEMLNDHHEHLTKLPGVKIPEAVKATSEIRLACQGKDLIVFVVPSVYVRSTAKLAAPWIEAGQKVVNLAKGIEESTLDTLSEVLEEEMPQADVAVLSGPSHAEEVGRKLPTTLVVGAHSKETAKWIQNVVMNDVLRVYTSSDIVGIELGGALKNVIALAAGIADGLGCGDNTKAALMTRGIAEITRLGVACGGSPKTFAGLSGIGDLIVTCTSRHSRNRNAGYLIGQGYKMQDAMDEVKMVVEGVYSAKAALRLAQKYDVDMPIVTEVNRVLFEDKPASEALKDLFLRTRKDESDDMGWD